MDGPSGTGKSDLLAYVHGRRADVELIQKATTRHKRHYESATTAFLDLRFVSQAAFADESFDYVYSYCGHEYGFHRAQLDAMLDRSRIVLGIVRSVSLIRQLKCEYSSQSVVAVFVDSDPLKLSERMANQGRTTKQVKWRLRRMALAAEDFARNPEVFDFVIRNNSDVVEYHRRIDDVLDQILGM